MRSIELLSEHANKFICGPNARLSAKLVWIHEQSEGTSQIKFDIETEKSLLRTKIPP
jgi:hypothetical protein